LNLSTFTSFEGRIGRRTFWLSAVILTILQWVLYAVVGGMSMMSRDASNPSMVGQDLQNVWPAWIITLVFLWPALAVYAKRWHDRGKSGWWSLILFVPLFGYIWFLRSGLSSAHVVMFVFLIGFIWFLVECGFLRGTEGPNQYGNDPLS